MITKEQMKALPLSDDTARLLSMMTSFKTSGKKHTTPSGTSTGAIISLRRS